MMGTLFNVIFIVAIAWLLYRRWVPVKGIKHLSATELKFELNNKDKQFIDVRTPNEFQLNHIKGFKNIPLSDLYKRADELSKDKEVFVICQSGMRSIKASRELKKMGFISIANIKGGMSAWHY